MNPLTPLRGYLWASPWSLCGVCLGGLALISGGRLQRHGGILEFSGGLLTDLLRHVPIRGGASAMTLGHVVIGANQEALDHCRDHELVHVRQYETWGPMFVPLYLWYAVTLWLQGRDAYWDNPFEIEAYSRESMHLRDI